MGLFKTRVDENWKINYIKEFADINLFRGKNINLIFDFTEYILRNQNIINLKCKCLHYL